MSADDRVERMRDLGTPSEGTEVVPAVPSATKRNARRRDAGRRALDRRVMAVVEGMSDAFLALDPDWRITYANRQAARLNGTTPEELVGQNHWERWPGTLGTEIERQYRWAQQEGEAIEFEHHYQDEDIWHEVRAYPADDGGLAVFYRDITAVKKLEEERRRQAHELRSANEKAFAAETQFRLLVEHVRDYAVFVMDPDGIVTHWGEGATRIKGYRADEAVGRHLRTFYPGEGSAEDGSAEEHLRHAAATGEYIGEGTRFRKNGEAFRARVVLTALRRDDELVGFSKITQDLTGERERERLLEDAMRAAQTANTAKSQFLANTSHEIRTPLNAVMGYAQLLELGLAGGLSDAQRQYVQRIQTTSHHLLSLINDVLDLSKIEAGEMRAAREPGRVHDAVATALHLVEPQSRAREIAIVNGCHEGAATAYRGDAERVRQILANLLSNAVRFTEPGGRVTVSCGSAGALPAGARHGHDEGNVEDGGAAPAGGWSFIRVEDTGSGIAPEQLDRIWDAFVQVDASRTRKFGGSGLGLTISRYLARLMGGEITVRSRPGLGSSFVLWLPAADPAEVPASRPGRGIETEGEVAAEVAMREVRAEDGSSSLRDISAALLTEVERVVSMYAARLHSDPETPSAHGLGEAQTEDHSVTFISDIAQCLLVVGADGPEAAAMLRDGSAIQRLIARRHGVQRARLGWAERELRRELQVLREEIHAAVLRRVNRSGAEEVERALGIINRFLSDAERETLESFAQELSAR